MRVLLISHTCQSITEGQPKAHALAELNGITLRVLAPDRWRRYGAWRGAQIPDSRDFEYQVAKVRFPWMGPAQTYLHYYPGLAAILREFRPDVIDLWEEPWSLVSVQTCRLRNAIVPHARIICETEQNIEKKLPFPFERFRAETLANADFAVGRSDEAVEILRRKGYRGAAQTVGNAVDENLFRPMDRQACRRELGLSRFVVGYVGRLVEEKGLSDLVDAIAQTPSDVNAVIVGDGPMRNALEARAGSNQRVRLLPGKPLAELPALMNALDVLVLVSRTTARWKEQFGRVLIEAQACGTPLIGSDSGAISAVVGGGGLVVPEQNPAALAAAIIKLRDDPQYRARLGEIGRKQVLARYTWKKVAQSMHDIYHQVATAPSARRTDLRGGRILQLDVLRGLAILLVLWFHPVVPPERAGFLRPLGALGMRIGYSGVDLFFVLSGFLIGGLLFKEIKTHGKLNVPRFWIRRGLKIWPGYYALMLLVFAQLARHGGVHSAVHQIWPSLITLQNYLTIVRGHTWSLAVEEHFYLVLPLLLAFLPRRTVNGRLTIPAMVGIAIFLAVLDIVLRLALVVAHTDMEHVRTDPTHLNIDSMFFGVLLAYTYHFHRDGFARIAARRELPILAALLLLPMFLLSPASDFMTGIGHTMMYLGYGLLLMTMMQAEVGRGVLGRMLAGGPARLLAFIGFYSYSIYLWFPDFVGNPIFYTLEHHAGHVPGALLWLIGMTVYIAATVVVGVIMAKLIEMPVLRLRNRWFPARAQITN